MNAVNWFEIPASNYERAAAFYETVLSIKLKADNEFAGLKMGIFPYADGKVGGAVVAGEGHQPGSGGTLVYLPAHELDAVLSRVESAGGQIILPRTTIAPEIGDIAIVRDTEGNHVGLHRPPM